MPRRLYSSEQLATFRACRRIALVGYAGWCCFEAWPDINSRINHLTTTDYLVIFAIGLGVTACDWLKTRLEAIEAKVDDLDTIVGSIQRDVNKLEDEMPDYRALSKALEAKLTLIDSGMGLNYPGVGRPAGRLGCVRD